jgi:RecB family exonuclease
MALMVTARTTRLLRTADLRAFRRTAIDLALEGSPLDARQRLLVVPSRAAGLQLTRGIEDRTPSALLPDIVTPRELTAFLGSRLPLTRPLLSKAERQVLLGVAGRTAAAAGTEPPFQLRPGLVAEMLELYDALHAHLSSVDAFERLALGRLEPGAAIDRGAARLVLQTRFLVATFRDFERRCAEVGDDEHALRRRVLAEPAARPYRHVVVTVSDRAFDPHGLEVADWDLLTRLPGLERLDILVTERLLAGALHERIHQLLPGIEEVQAPPDEEGGAPVLLVPPTGETAHTSRDREEEVADFTRRVKRAVRRNEVALERCALVVEQPLPYLYVARELFRSAGVPSQMFDALPLAAEPYAAALDLVLAAVAGNFARVPSIAVLRSPQFAFASLSEGGTGLPPALTGTTPVPPLTMNDVADLDRALAEAGYLGDLSSLESLRASWSVKAEDGPTPAMRAADVLIELVRQLVPLREPAPVAAQLRRLQAFLTSRQRHAGGERPRERRARRAVLGIVETLRDAHARLDDQPVPFDDVAALLRRWIDSHTFAPRSGESGVHVVDAESARFGDFGVVQLAGLVDGEWPDRPRRNIFFPPEILRDLGWPAEAQRRDGARARFGDLLRLPSSRLIVSTFSLEADALVSPSPLIDEVEAAGLERLAHAVPAARVFEMEALSANPVNTESLGAVRRAWVEQRLASPGRGDRAHRGFTDAHRARAFSLSALERYQDCPFKYFAADVLRLEEEAEDASATSPRARGRFVHEVFERFFEAWDARSGGAITPARLDEARAVCEEVALPLLARLHEAEAAIEHVRLFGSAISTGAVDVVLGHEASRPLEVRERWLEYRLEGDFTLGATGGRPVPLRGIADRIDLLPGRRLRVVDYKTGRAPNPKRALQVPIYALCAKERLEARDGAAWTVDEAAYVSFGGRRSYVPVVRAAEEGGEPLAAARSRVGQVLDGIGRGEFPPRPHDPVICRYCAFASVCRKDYVDDE